MRLVLKCKCTDGEIGLSVRDRGDGEDIRHYMDYVQLEVALWHQHRGCGETKLEYLKIPVTADKPIGVS